MSMVRVFARLGTQCVDKTHHGGTLKCWPVLILACVVTLAAPIVCLQDYLSTSLFFFHEELITHLYASL